MPTLNEPPQNTDGPTLFDALAFSQVDLAHARETTRENGEQRGPESG